MRVDSAYVSCYDEVRYAVRAWRTVGHVLIAVIMVAGMLAVRSAEETALDRYVAQPDASYAWKVVKTAATAGLDDVRGRSQVADLRTPDEVDRTLWQHWLVIAKPDGAKSDTAMLFIGGGQNGGDPPQGAE